MHESLEAGDGAEPVGECVKALELEPEPVLF